MTSTASSTDLMRAPEEHRPDSERWKVLLRGFLVAVIGAGIAVRFVLFAYKPDFWMDEAALAYNVATRSFAGLLQTLDHDQSAPYGFLVLAKFLGGLSGYSERVLCIPSLLAGFLTLFLVWQILRPLGSPLLALGGVAIVAMSPEMIHYSVEFKPYSIDAAVATLLIWLFLQRDRAPSAWGFRAALAAAAVLTPWFSIASVFMLAGAGSVALAHDLLRRRLKSAAELGILLLAGALSAILQYYFCFRHVAQVAAVHPAWAGTFAPLLPRTMEELRWFVGKPSLFFSSPLGAGFRYLAVALFAWGCVVLFRRDRWTLALLVAPLLPLWVASGLHRYPAVGRMVLFLVPLAALVLAVGLGTMWTSTRRAVALAGVAAFLGLMWGPVKTEPGVVMEAVRLKGDAGYARATGALKGAIGEGDRVVVTEQARCVYAFYARDLVLGERLIQLPNGVDSAVIQNIMTGPLAGVKRVWLFYADFEAAQAGSETAVLTAGFGEGWRRMRVEDFRTVSLACYERVP